MHLLILLLLNCTNTCLIKQVRRVLLVCAVQLQLDCIPVSRFFTEKVGAQQNHRLSKCFYFFHIPAWMHKQLKALPNLSCSSSPSPYYRQSDSSYLDLHRADFKL